MNSPPRPAPIRDEDVLAQEIANRIVSRRQYLKLTQSDVAARMGIPEGTYGRWETGRVRFSAPQITTVADALHVPVAYLFGEYTEDIGPEEAEVIQTWRALPPPFRRVAKSTMQALLAEHFGIATEEPTANMIPTPARGV